MPYIKQWGSLNLIHCFPLGDSRLRFTATSGFRSRCACARCRIWRHVVSFTPDSFNYINLQLNSISHNTHKILPELILNKWVFTFLATLRNSQFSEVEMRAKIKLTHACCRKKIIYFFEKSSRYYTWCRKFRLTF